MNDYCAVPCFPEAIVYVSTVNVDKNIILDYMKKVTFIKLNQGKNCYMSKDINVFDGLSFLKDEAKKHVEQYIRKIMSYNMDFKFLNSWVSKTEPKGESEAHSHSNTFLSGVYYPEGSEGFSISFFKKQQFFWHIKTDEINNFNATSQTVQITNDNTLILFPSDLRHKIDLNNSNVDRYSLAFNINPSGYIGSGDGRIFF